MAGLLLLVATFRVREIFKGRQINAEIAAAGRAKIVANTVSALVKSGRKYGAHLRDPKSFENTAGR